MVMISLGMSLFLFFGRLLFDFVFFFDFNGGGAIDSAEGAQAALAQSPVPFQLSLRLDCEPGPGNGGEASFGNGLAGQLANAVGVLLDALEGFFDFVNRILIGGKPA